MTLNKGINLPPETHALIMREGTAEDVILGKIIDAERFILPSSSILEISRRLSPEQFQEKYLHLDYDFPVCIFRFVDSRSEEFKLDNLYIKRFPVYNIYTCPEIEMLCIIKEGRSLITPIRTNSVSNHALTATISLR